MDCTDFNLKSEVEYKGLLESLNTLKKIAIENKIEAIFSFSQGSLLTLLLILLIEFEDEYKFAFKNLKCIILCAAFLDPFPNNFEIRDKKEIIQSLLSKIDDTKNQGLINTPILNIFGETDEFIKKEKSKNIEKLFKNVESFIHPGKHFVPSSKEDIERYVIFLQKHIIED